MIHPSVYSQIVRAWTWGGLLITLVSLSLFVASLIWLLSLTIRRKSGLRRSGSALPPHLNAWELDDSRSSTEDESPKALQVEEDGEWYEEGAVPSIPAEVPLHRSGWRTMAWILFHAAFGLATWSIAFWPWVHVAFDLASFWGGLIGMWAIIVVAWTIAAPPSLFGVILGLCTGAYSGESSASPRVGRSRAYRAVVSFSEKAKHALICMWTESLRQKLIGTPSHQEIQTAKDKKIKPRWYRKRWGRLLVFYGGLAAMLFLAWFLMYTTCSICITDHTVSFSTRFSRSFSSPSCGVGIGSLCHIYVMPPYNGSSEMIVNVVVLGSRGATPVRVFYDSAPSGDKQTPSSYRFMATAEAVIQLPLPEGEGVRYSQAVLLPTLSPNTVYHFIVSLASSGDVSSPLAFRTLPTEGEVPIVIGGDSGTEAPYPKLLDFVATKDVRMIVVAGDISYANGMRSCYRRWDDWLTTWHRHLRTVEGYLVPLVTSIGNHDVGPGGYGTYWSGLFVQSKQALYAKKWQDRQTYHAHVIANHTVLVVLDTGHVFQAEDQVSWMNDVLHEHASFPNKLAAYHVPLYPSRRSYSDDINIDLRKHWLPVFDGHNLTIGFEHHDHSYKRTKKMRANKPDESGTLYLGDGCFGVTKKKPDTSRFYLEKAEAVEHGFIMRISDKGLDIEAFDASGNIFDKIAVNSTR